MSNLSSSMFMYNSIPLLDKVPSAYAAYSVRKLRSAYSGSCLKVRRSSDNATQDIGFANGLINTASLLTFCGAGNGFIDTWYNQVGSGAPDAVQATAAAQPQIVASGALITSNGRLTAQFSNARKMTFTASSTNPKVMIAVAQETSSFTTAQRIIYCTTAGAGELYFLNATNTVTSNAGTALSATSVNASMNSIIALQDGASSWLRVNGVKTTGNAGTGTWSVSAMQLGDVTTLGLKGNLGEAIIYATGITDTQASIIYSSQRQFFGTV